jgi:hypothetical protein
MAAARSRSEGFTLIESLAALGVTALIVLCSTSLLRDSVFFFDRGTRAADQTERFALVADRLSRDFGAARYALQSEAGRPQVVFAANPEGTVRFVTGGGTGGARRDEVVQLSIESDGDSRQLVRRSAAWIGPRARLSEVAVAKPVVLLSGALDMSFKFGRLTSEGALEWQDQWTGAEGLPRFVKLTLIDLATGVDLTPGDGFPIFANAPMSCAAGKDDCLTPGKADAGAAASPTPTSPQQSSAQASP